MLRNTDSETEILLGNKQLLGVFFVVAILLGIAFTSGYMVGRGGAGKKAETPSAAEPTSGKTATGPGGETHSVPADSGLDTSSEAGNNAASAQNEEEPPLGSPKRRSNQKTAAGPTAETASESFTPESGQEFLQVAAVTREEAAAIADVLHKKGFRAHSVPKPSNPKVYRVLIGPIHDAGDLSSTRDALHKTGFREVIVQHY